MLLLLLLPYPNKLNESWWNGNEVTIFLAVDIKEAAGDALDELLLPFDDFDFDSLDDFNFESGWFDGSFVADEAFVFSLSTSNSLLSSFSFLILFEFFFDFLLTLIIFFMVPDLVKLKNRGNANQVNLLNFPTENISYSWKKAQFLIFVHSMWIYIYLNQVIWCQYCPNAVKIESENERGIKDYEKEQRILAN